jgi:hypothetical protein
MNKDQECLGRDGHHAATLYVLSLPSLLTLSVLEPKVGVRAPRGGPDP